MEAEKEWFMHEKLLELIISGTRSKNFFLTAGDAKKAGLSVQRKQLEAHGTGQSERHPEEEKNKSD